jgi:hypothetical protein
MAVPVFHQQCKLLINQRLHKTHTLHIKQQSNLQGTGQQSTFRWLTLQSTFNYLSIVTNNTDLWTKAQNIIGFINSKSIAE